MNGILNGIYNYAINKYTENLKRYIKEVAMDERNFEYLVILTCKAGENPDVIIVGQKGNLMISKKESFCETFDTDRYAVKYPVEINGIDKVINLREERKKIINQKRKS